MTAHSLQVQLDGIIERTDWARLFHAYDAAADTPGYLSGLLAEDAEVFNAALSHLNSAVLHQGTIFPVTPAAVQVVVFVLSAPVLRMDGGSRLVALLDFLAAVGESLGWVELPAHRPVIDPAEVDRFFAEWSDEAWSEPGTIVDDMCASAVFELLGLVTEVLAALGIFLTDENQSVRESAIEAVGNWASLNRADPIGAVSALEKQLEKATSRDERARLVLALGELGVDLSRLLTDGDPAIRACAALSIKSVAGTAELIAALAEPQLSDTWFGSRPAAFRGRPRYTLQAELLSRQLSFEELLPTALAIVPLATAMSADYDWGPLLAAAFPEVAFAPGQHPDPPQALSKAQRTFVAALVDNDSLWDPRSGNASLARMKVGLPDDRSEVATLLRELPASERRWHH